MKQEAFEALHAPAWRRFEAWLSLLDDRRQAGRAAEFAHLGAAFPEAYRAVCHHLALARARRYSFGLQQRLNQLALDGHRHLYRARAPRVGAVGHFFAVAFPAAFRRYAWPILAAALLFVVPGLSMAIAVQFESSLIYSLLDTHDVAMLEAMYDPANEVLGRERSADTDFQMFGYYIYNNVSIGFQTFAGGLLFGVGSIFYLVFNGLFIGAVAGHLTSIGYGETFWNFVAGHSALELTAIVIFGGIGLALGYAALAPGRKRRWHAVRERAADSLPLILGGAGMLLGAAFVEAYWSSTTWPPNGIKYGVGIGFWLLVGLYFGLCGRGCEGPPAGDGAAT